MTRSARNGEVLSLYPAPTGGPADSARLAFVRKRKSTRRARILLEKKRRGQTHLHVSVEANQQRSIRGFTYRFH